MLGANLYVGQVAQHFDGQLDEWYVFAQALSEAEIEDLMVLVQEPISGLVAGNDGPTGLGEATGLTASVASGSHVRYEWDFGDGSALDDSGPVVSHVYPAVGTFTAVVTARNDVSSQSAATTVVVEEVPPVAAFTSSSPDVLGEATVFRNASTGTNLSYEWDFGDGSPRESDVDPSHTYAVTGTFTVVLSATNSLGTDVAWEQVVITDRPSAPPSLRGHWRLDEVDGQRADSSSYANHLTEHNTVGSVGGQVGLAADLERDDGEYLSIGDGVQEGLDITGSLTLAGWMNVESLDQDQIMAAKYEFGVDNRAYRLYVRYNNVLAFLVSPDGNYTSGDLLQASPPGGLSPGTWYHVAGVFDAEERTLSIYLDGDLIGSRSVTYDTIYDSSAPFMLGANLYVGQVAQHFDGQLDEWYVFAQVLSEAEIVDLMATPAP
jgi:PKD repeat protein